MATVIYIICAVVFGAGAYFKGKEQLHMAQLEGYKPKQYWWWIRRNIGYLFLKEILLLLPAAALYIIYRLNLYTDVYGYLIVSLWVLGGLYLTYTGFKNRRQPKTPLKFTKRATRLFVAYLLLTVMWACLSYIGSSNFMEFVFYIGVARFLIPVNMLLATYIMYPVEAGVNYRYFHSAQVKIGGMKNLKVIGITGSYGKTSTKYFVKTILSEKYNTLMTPESFNTPMGITRVIREQLTEEHEVFVCEMGARNIGDIRTLCKLVSPTIGILTSIGPQHLETFKTIQNVANTKYELIQALPFDGTAIFNGDNKYCLELARKTGIETFIYGIENNEEDIFLKAGHVENSRTGLKFRVYTNDGREFDCCTNLLGKHNVSNLLAAICTALKLGLSIEEIQRGMEKIEPVPHRLQLINSGNGVTVIDDAFNSNPEGSRQALETIRDFTGGNRIVVTPGMVELGTIEYQANREFGKIMAGCCDIAILIGFKRSKPIMEGLKEGNFPEERIIVTRDLNEATAKFGRIVKAGDVVLFENDLPDNYNEV